MNAVNINVRTDAEIKTKAESILAELGMNMSTAVNLFLRQIIRENGIPFDLKLEIPNPTTEAAIREGLEIANDPNAKGYRSMDELKAALDL